VSDPVAFRYEQGKHNDLISGLFALDFFELSRPNVPTLDLFLGPEGQVVDFIRYIKDREGYDAESHEVI